MSPVKSKCYSVITADVIGSRGIVSFTQKLTRELRSLTNLHLRQKLILSPYAVTAGDEFEVVLAKPEYTPRAVLDLRRLFYPLELRIAIGIGKATGVHTKPVNLHGGGEAFIRARRAAERLKAGYPKYRLMTVFDSGNELFDLIANTVYRLQDSLTQRTTGSQWAAINTRLETGRQDRTARRLKLDVSTVSRNLKRGYYWHLVETTQAMEHIIRAYF
jgi:hypothetical protein